MTTRLEVVEARLEEGGGPILGARNARRTWRERRGLILELHDTEGRLGRGEASPLPGYSPDTLEEAHAALGSWIADLPTLDLESEIASQVGRAVSKLAPPSARFAAETALLDLAGRCLERPIHALLGVADPKPAGLCALIASSEPETAIAQAHAARERGIGVVKVKIGAAGAFERELELLGALRSELGPLGLRLDANGALPRDELAERLTALARFEPELLEEPCHDMTQIETSPVHLGADETLQHPGAWERLEPLRRRGLLHALVLKPMALGGSVICLELARRAAAEGIAVTASHLFDGPVALAAAAHLALALPGERLASGLDRHAGLGAWPAVELPIFTENQICATGRPGLGFPR